MGEGLHGVLYVFGGHNNIRCLANSERYSLSTDCWSQLARMPTARQACSAVSSGGSINVFGGFNGKQALRNVERFDPASGGGGRWTSLEKMPLSCYEFASAGVAG